MANGALDGRHIGAGGGWFLMFYADDKAKLRCAMRLGYSFDGPVLLGFAIAGAFA